MGTNMNNVRQQKTSKHSKPIPAPERRAATDKVIIALLRNEISSGQALKAIRVQIIGLNQDDYAKMVGISRKTLSDIENDRGNYKTNILDKVFKPAGLKVGLVPIASQLFDKV